jgi:hypothetical protein
LLSLEFRYNRVANDFLGFVSMRINAPPISCEEAEIWALRQMFMVDCNKGFNPEEA